MSGEILHPVGFCGEEHPQQLVLLFTLLVSPPCCRALSAPWEESAHMPGRILLEWNGLDAYALARAWCFSTGFCRVPSAGFVQQ